MNFFSKYHFFHESVLFLCISIRHAASQKFFTNHHHFYFILFMTLFSILHRIFRFEFFILLQLTNDDFFQI